MRKWQEVSRSFQTQQHESTNQLPTASRPPGRPRKYSMSTNQVPATLRPPGRPRKTSKYTYDIFDWAASL